MSRSRRTAIGALIGVLPGLVLVLLTVPITGEWELTLGVLGIFFAVVGLLVGAASGALRR